MPSANEVQEILKRRLDAANYEKLMQLANPSLHAFVAESIELGNPDAVFVCTDSDEDIAHVRRQAIDQGEETLLKMEGHTIHFDGYNDQGRDKKATRYLVKPDDRLGPELNSMGRDEGLAEVKGYLKGAMVGKTALVRFFCLGPVNSRFSISGVQVTDSWYVAHSEDLLYRPGFEQFKKLGDSPSFFKVTHSAGELDERNCSKNIEKRRVYIDLHDEMVYSVNTQYAGNTVGFKKLALRLAITKADREGWLAEHMFVLAVNNVEKGRKTYFTGAYPSACGKTSTAMIPGERIVGDDIAYLRKVDGAVRAVNVESGIFGIIANVNAEDDAEIWGALTTPRELILSNVLNADGVPYWLGDKRQHPTKGVNHSGEWVDGKKDDKGEEVELAHKNARYTIRLEALGNLDPLWNDPAGIEVGGIIYGGRDSDTWVPVQQSMNWRHGVITMGAALESETTSATIGAEGVRTWQPMSNLDFIAIPLGKYVQNHLDFIQDLRQEPVIFAVNYFLVRDGKPGAYITGMHDKKIWLRWMELRLHGEVDAITGPTGLLPRFDDLKALFKAYLGKDYTEKDYVEQFTIRVPENLAKLDRIRQIFAKRVPDAPAIVAEELKAQQARLEALRAKHGKDYVSPLAL